MLTENPVAEAFGLYVVLTDPAVGYVRCAEAAVAEGIRYVQLRMKGAPREDIVATGRRLRAVTRGTATRLIVNDDVAIAAEIDADGVHLGQEDLSLDAARALWPEQGKVFGLSTHGLRQAAEAEAAEPDYIGVGPIFPTPTKAVPDPTVGLEQMQRIMAATSLTAVAIGGINAENLPEVLAHGATNFAVVRAVTRSSTPRDAIRRLMDIWREHAEPLQG